MGRSIISILLVDDNKPWRRFVGLTLQTRDKLQVIGEVGDGMEAVARAQELQPDLIVLDVGLPTINGIEAARQIRKVSPASKILFLSQARSAEIAAEALATGACGYVVKSDGARELLRGIRTVLDGKTFVSASLCDKNLTIPKDERVHYPSEFQPLRQADGNATQNHKIHVFGDEPAFVDGVAGFIAATLRNGRPVVVLATEPHRASIARKLSEDGVDVGTAVKGKLFTTLDVADSVAKFRLAEHRTEEAVKAAEGNPCVGVA